MPKPTSTALAKKPQAVVIQQFLSRDPLVIVLRDFEWFESDSARDEWFAYSIAWAVDDVNDHGDVFYVFAEVTDTTTTPLTLGKVEAQGADGEWESNAVKAVQDDPQTLLAPVVVKATAKTKAAAVPPSSPKPKGTAKVKARAASAAAAVVKGETPDTTPVVKSKTVRVRKNAAAPPEAPTVPVAPTGGDKRAAALKKRLAEKQAQGGTKRVTAADQEAVDLEVADMEAHSKEPALVGPST